MRTTVLVLLLSVAAVGAAPLAAVTHAQTTRHPYVLTVTGPSTATSGQEVTYTVHYRLTDPFSPAGASFRIRAPNHGTLVSTQVVSGTPGILVHQDEMDIVWGQLGQADAPEGDVEFVVRIDQGFIGSIFAFAYVSGTAGFGSNAVETEVFAQGALPEMGGGSGEGHFEFSLVVALAAVLGTVLIAAGAASRKVGNAK